MCAAAPTRDMARKFHPDSPATSLVSGRNSRKDARHGEPWASFCRSRAMRRK
jgi:hypothetical protein